MQEEMSLRELLSIFKKYIKPMILVTVVFMLVAAVISFFILERQYSTSTTLMVGRPQDVRETDALYSEIRLNQQLVPTYSELIRTRAVADEVISTMDLDITYEQFRNKVGVSSVNNTELIQIQVTDTDPELAADIANHTSEVFMDTVVDVMNIENIQVIDEAQVPLNPVSPRPMLNIAIAAVLGFMIAVFIGFLKEFLDNTIKTPEDVEKYLETPVLGMIPKEN